MPSGKSSNPNLEAFHEWWASSRCEGDYSRDTGDYLWARNGFDFGVSYAVATKLPVHPNDKESYEQTITELIAKVKRLETRASVAEDLACRRGEVLMNLRKDAASDIADDEILGLTNMVGMYEQIIKLLAEAL